MKRRLNILLVTILLLITFNVEAINEEVVFNTTSSFIQKSDSLPSDFYNKAKDFYAKQDYSNALDFALKTLKITNIEANRDLYIRVNFLIGNIFYKTRNYKRAIKYHQIIIKPLINYNSSFKNKDIELADTVFNNQFIYVDNLLQIGSSYHRLKERDTLKIYKDSALYYFDKVIKINSLDKSIIDLKAKAYTNLSAIYINDTLYFDAKNFANKAITIHKNQNNKVNQAAAIGNLASVYLLEENYSKAKSLYFDGLELIKNDNSDNAIRHKANLYYNLAWALYNLKDYKAYDFQELSYDIEDGLREKEVRGLIKELDAKYNFNAAKKLLLKEEENKRLKAKAKSDRVLQYGVLTIFILIFIAGYFLFRQKNLSLKLSQTQLLQEKNIEKLKSESQIRILNATIDGKESERKEIAETLHDNVSALLSSANLHLQATRTQFNGETPIEIDKTQEIITEASQKIRDLSHTLVSSVLLKFGLNYAIKDMAEKYSNSQLKVGAEIKNIRRYHQSFEIKTNNIIQELVNNILKHSNAKNATIYLEEKENYLCLRIHDDGDGFDINEITNKDGLGINQIDARIQMMKGKFNIESIIGTGTKISVELPIQEKEVVNLS